MALIAALAASAMPLLLLAAWALLYPHTQGALLAPAAAALLAFLAAWRLACARRRALADAALLPGARLRPLVAGRLGAAVGAAALVALPLPAIAYFTLDCGLAGWSAIAALAVGSALLQAALQPLLATQVRPAFQPGLLAPPLLLLVAAPVAATHAFIDYGTRPLPAWVDEPGLAAMLAAGIAALPHPETRAGDVLALLRSAEVFAYWLLKLDGGRSLPLIAFVLLRDALVFFGLAAWLQALQALALLSLPARGGTAAGRTR